MPFRLTKSKSLAGRSDLELYGMVCGRGSDRERAFKELYRRYAPRIHAYCYKIIEEKEAAEDVFQETFVRFYMGAREARSMTNLSGYLFRIARNLSLNAIRDREPLEPIEGLELKVSADHSLEKNELLGLIASAVELLDFDYREAFILHAYENMSYEEIADLVGCSLANAKSRVFRAKQKIRKLLEPNIKELD